MQLQVGVQRRWRMQGYLAGLLHVPGNKPRDIATVTAVGWPAEAAGDVQSADHVGSGVQATAHITRLEG